MSQRVPLLGKSAKKQPTRGLLIAPRVKPTSKLSGTPSQSTTNSTSQHSTEKQKQSEVETNSQHIKPEISCKVEQPSTIQRDNVGTTEIQTRRSLLNSDLIQEIADSFDQTPTTRPTSPPPTRIITTPVEEPSNIQIPARKLRSSTSPTTRTISNPVEVPNIQIPARKLRSSTSPTTRIITTPVEEPNNIQIPARKLRSSTSPTTRIITTPVEEPNNIQIPALQTLQSTPRLASRGIIAPGQSFGLPPPAKEVAPRTPQRQSPKVAHLRSNNSTTPSNTNHGQSSTPHAVTPPRLTLPTSNDNLFNPRFRVSDGERDNVPPKRSSRLKTLREPRRGNPQPKKRKKRCEIPLYPQKPIKQRFIEYSQEQKPIVKRKASVKEGDDDGEEEYPYESDYTIASMTMGELAMTVPKGRKKEVEEEDASSEINSIETREPVRQRNDTPSRPRGMPQVEIVNGQIVLSKESLTFNEDDMFHEEDQELSDEIRGSGGSCFKYGKRSSKKWSHLETKQFYYCLSQVGPDFTLMETMFPNRSRAELKLKFKSEEKRHRSLIELALKSAGRPLDDDIIALATEKLKAKQSKKNGVEKQAASVSNDKEEAEESKENEDNEDTEDNEDNVDNADNVDNEVNEDDEDNEVDEEYIDDVEDIGDAIFI